MMTRRRMPTRRHHKTIVATLRISWPWWLHPACGLLLLTGSMAVLSIVLPPDAYLTWGVPKYLDVNLSLTLIVCVAAMLAGIVFSSGAAARGGTAEIAFTARQLQWLRRGYHLMFFLVLVGYAAWATSAIVQGIRLGDLYEVLARAEGAIGDLKQSSRPIGGVTTLTQFGPLVVVIGYVLRKVADGGRGFYWLLLLAALRMLFYAERLAVIEVVVPLLLIGALTTQRKTFLGRMVRAAPLIAVPALWALFAISEYNRSWIFYEQTAALPFPQWVTLRLLGYYTTSFNNSALIATQLDTSTAPPYFIATGFWSAPGIESALPHPGIAGLPPEQWWATTLAQMSNPEFTNAGSFLTVVGEIGTVGAIGYWLLTGVVIGAIFTAMTRGSLAGLLTTVTIFVGVLELPRLIYWSLGRSFPFLLALVIIALFYPRAYQRAQKRPHRLANAVKQ